MEQSEYRKLDQSNQRLAKKLTASLSILHCVWAAARQQGDAFHWTSIAQLNTLCYSTIQKFGSLKGSVAGELLWNFRYEKMNNT